MEGDVSSRACAEGRGNVCRVVASYGAGTNSTAMLVEMLRRGEPCDAVVFADTGGERPETYAYVDMFSEWMVARGYPAIVTVCNGGMHGTLEAECRAKRHLPSIAYGYGSCSDKYKRRPFQAWLRSQCWQDVTCCIGFDADEAHRAARGGAANDPYRKRYPLVEWNMGRDECIEAIRAAGLPLPGKSACFFCPSSRPQEVLELKRRHPDLLARALAIESNAELTSITGLGRRWRWADLVRFDDAQGDLFAVCGIDAPCGCYDG